MTASDWRASRFKRLQARLIPAIGYPLVAALGSTFRWRQEGLEHLDAVTRNGRQPIMAFWHGRILPATVYFRRRGIVVITSENFDGEWIAGIIERFGYGTARGSTENMLRPVGSTSDRPRAGEPEGPAATRRPASAVSKPSRSPAPCP